MTISQCQDFVHTKRDELVYTKLKIYCMLDITYKKPNYSWETIFAKEMIREVIKNV